MDVGDGIELCGRRFFSFFMVLMGFNFFCVDIFV